MFEGLILELKNKRTTRQPLHAAKARRLGALIGRGGCSRPALSPSGPVESPIAVILSLAYVPVLSATQQQRPARHCRRLCVRQEARACPPILCECHARVEWPVD